VIYFNAVILAIVEGLTEFLPISSTGHLILVERFLPIDGSDESRFSAAFEVLIQLPAIAAVVVYFWSKLWPFGRGEEHRSKTMALWFRVAVAFVPAAAMGFLLHDLITSYLMYSLPVAIALIVGGVVLIALEQRHHDAAFDSVHDLSFRTAFGIGVIQCLALFPGTSRSAATIIGAMLLGAGRSAAAEFSFFLAVPTMLGASTLTIVKEGLGFTPQQWGLIALGSVVSFITAYAAIAFLMRYIQRNSFTGFGIYRIVLGGIVLLAYFVYGM
jgi:undecaprenyl-diphosphatase